MEGGLSNFTDNLNDKLMKLKDYQKKLTRYKKKILILKKLSKTNLQYDCKHSLQF